MSDNADIDAWLDQPPGPDAVAEAAYSIARGSHRGELPRHLKTPWWKLKKDYRETLIFIADHAMRSKH